MPSTSAAARVAGALLAAAALAGTLVGSRAPGRWGRPGGLALIGGLALLATRDVAMVGSGSLGRLRPVPAALLVTELATSTTSIAIGAPAWLSRTPDRSSRTRAASQLASLTFAVHTLRQLIYLSPGQGRVTEPAATWW